MVFRKCIWAEFFWFNLVNFRTNRTNSQRLSKPKRTEPTCLLVEIIKKRESWKMFPPPVGPLLLQSFAIVIGAHDSLSLSIHPIKIPLLNALKKTKIIGE